LDEALSTSAHIASIGATQATAATATEPRRPRQANIAINPASPIPATPNQTMAAHCHKSENSDQCSEDASERARGTHPSSQRCKLAKNQAKADKHSEYTITATDNNFGSAQRRIGI
jgi:hypothetical protein